MYDDQQQQQRRKTGVTARDSPARHSGHGNSHNSVNPLRSAFAGSRQASEDSRQRFRNNRLHLDVQPQSATFESLDDYQDEALDMEVARPNANVNIVEEDQPTGSGKGEDEDGAEDEEDEWSKPWNKVRRLSRVAQAHAGDFIALRRATEGLGRIRMRGHLNYGEIVQRFERQSTFHGISHAALAPNNRWKWFWRTAFMVCLSALIVQIALLIMKYREYAKTVDLDLKFENAPFPSVTLCNLNPYKKSQIERNPATRETMEAFANIVSRGDQSEGVAAALAAQLHNRVRRAQRLRARHRRADGRRGGRRKPRRFQQVLSKCECAVEVMSSERKGSCFASLNGTLPADLQALQQQLHLRLSPSRCLCQLDAVSLTLWPCFPYGSWKERLCAECVDSIGHCPMRFYRGNEKFETIKDKVDLCLCHPEYNHCVQSNDDGKVPEIGSEGFEADFQRRLLSGEAAGEDSDLDSRGTTTTTTTQAPEVVQALGFENLTDDIALATQAQTNLMFAVGVLNDTEKVRMGQTKEEFILKCSFNQKDCDIERDFKLHYDQTYGNCFTFNWNRTLAVGAHRAGANYGLRVLLYANVSEYLQTSESIGFRITVHDKWIMPFPDAFGYNAPTGFLSSFGVRMKQFLRISAPHGACQEGGEESADYIYYGFNYSVEGCHRSCTQKEVIRACGCGDPTYPLPRNSNVTSCAVTDPVARECVRNTTQHLGNLIAEGSLANCHCHQPCVESNYEVTYSAARWPSGSAKVGECLPGDMLCLDRYRRNAAMIQIFYEELNYETMTETPAYTFSSFMADFGGVTGLWIGASVVSLLEIVALVVFTAQAYVRKRKGSLASMRSASVHSASTKRSVVSSIRPTKLSFHDLAAISHQSSQSKLSKASIKEPTNVVLVGGPSKLPSTSSSSSSSASSRRTKGSCRYIAPGEDLPCLCKYDKNGQLKRMLPLCPEHGYMVRRNLDYTLSDSSGGNIDDGAENLDDIASLSTSDSTRRASGGGGGEGGHR